MGSVDKVYELRLLIGKIQGELSETSMELLKLDNKLMDSYQDIRTPELLAESVENFWEELYELLHEHVTSIWYSPVGPNGHPRYLEYLTRQHKKMNIDNPTLLDTSM